MYQKPEDKQKAEFLYLHTDLTQQEISDIIGVSRRTMYNWIRESSWKRARYVANNAPQLLVEQYYNQLGAINKAIAARTERPYATLEEAEIIRKLTITINKTWGDKNPAGLVVSVFEDFIYNLRKDDKHLAEQVLGPVNAYVQEVFKGVQGIEDTWANYIYRLQDELECEEEVKAQQHSKSAREFARKQATDEQAAKGSEKPNEQFETAGKEPNKLTVNTDTQAATTEIAQPAVSVETGNKPSGHTPDYYTGYLQARYNIAADPHITRRTTATTGITILRSASTHWGHDECLFWR